MLVMCSWSPADALQATATEVYSCRATSTDSTIEKKDLGVVIIVQRPTMPGRGYTFPLPESQVWATAIPGYRDVRTSLADVATAIPGYRDVRTSLADVATAIPGYRDVRTSLADVATAIPGYRDVRTSLCEKKNRPEGRFLVGRRCRVNQGLSTSIRVSPIRPASPVWDTAPRWDPLASPDQLTLTVPVDPTVAEAGAESTARLPPDARGTSQ